MPKRFFIALKLSAGAGWWLWSSYLSLTVVWSIVRMETLPMRLETMVQLTSLAWALLSGYFFQTMEVYRDGAGRRTKWHFSGLLFCLGSGMAFYGAAPFGIEIAFPDAWVGTSGLLPAMLMLFSSLVLLTIAGWLSIGRIQKKYSRAQTTALPAE